MAQAQGSQSKTYMGVECDVQNSDSLSTYWGAGLRTSYKAFYLPFKTNTIRKSVDQILSEQITATRQPSAPARGNVDIGGDISAEMEAKAHGMMWFAALGNRSVTLFTSTTQTGFPATVTQTEDFYRHQFWIGNLSSFVVWKEFSDIDQYFQYVGCMVNTISLTISSSGFAEVVINMMGKQEANDTSAYSTGNNVDVSGTTFDNFNATLAEGPGGSYTNLSVVIEMTMEYNNNLDGSSVLVGGGGVRAGIAAGVPSVSGNLRAIFADTTLYDKAINKTETGLRITLVNDDTLATGENGKEKLIITMPEVYLTPNAPAIEGMGGVVMDLGYSAFYANEAVTGKSTAFHVELWNQVPDYTDGA